MKNTTIRDRDKYIERKYADFNKFVTSIFLNEIKLNKDQNLIEKVENIFLNPTFENPGMLTLFKMPVMSKWYIFPNDFNFNNEEDNNNTLREEGCTNCYIITEKRYSIDINDYYSDSYKKKNELEEIDKPNIRAAIESNIESKTDKYLKYKHKLCLSCLLYKSNEDEIQITSSFQILNYTTNLPQALIINIVIEYIAIHFEKWRPVTIIKSMYGDSKENEQSMKLIDHLNQLFEFDEQNTQIYFNVMNKWDDDLIISLKYNINAQENKIIWTDSLFYHHLRCAIEYNRDYITQLNNRYISKLEKGKFILLQTFQKKQERFQTIDCYNIFHKLREDYILRYVKRNQDRLPSIDYLEDDKLFKKSFEYLIWEKLVVFDGEGCYYLYFNASNKIYTNLKKHKFPRNEFIGIK